MKSPIGDRKIRRGKVLTPDLSDLPGHPRRRLLALRPEDQGDVQVLALLHCVEGAAETLISFSDLRKRKRNEQREMVQKSNLEKFCAVPELASPPTLDEELGAARHHLVDKFL